MSLSIILMLIFASVIMGILFYYNHFMNKIFLKNGSRVVKTK